MDNMHLIAKFANYFATKLGKALPDQPKLAGSGKSFPRVVQIYTKFPSFASVLSVFYTVFPDEIQQFY